MIYIMNTNHTQKSFLLKLFENLEQCKRPSPENAKEQEELLFGVAGGGYNRPWEKNAPMLFTIHDEMMTIPLGVPYLVYKTSSPRP